MGLADIAQNFDVGRPEDMEHLQRFFDIEDQALAKGTLPSDFTVITAALPADDSDTAAERRAPSRPALFGMKPTRQLRPPPEFGHIEINLTVSKVDTMLLDQDGHYISVGQSALSAIERALGGGTPKTILDLPCGFGRVTRALRARFPGAKITVSDLDRPGVDFSAKQFDARAAYSVRDFRDLALGEAYDLIWVGSLITHLPAMQTRFLLSALGRHLSPNGVALVTLHGPKLIPRLRQTGYGLPAGRAEAVIAQFEQIGYGYADYEGGDDLYGVSLTNDHYGISLSSESWMKATLPDLGLKLENYEVQAWDDHHDIAVIRHNDAALAGHASGGT
jgi:SAM-dependent methyltransferase